MVTEIAIVSCHPGTGDAMALRLPAALRIIAEDPECLKVAAHRGIEDPDRFVFTIQWTSIDAHEQFRQSYAMAEYRSHISEFLLGDPLVGHFIDVITI